jgi:thiol-disulfide isomerase/thioredoxin
MVNMNFKHILLGFFALLLFVSVEAQEKKSVQATATKRTWKLNVGDEAPNFTFKDMNGKEVSIKDFRGKYLYIDVWTTTCGSCIRQFPYLKKLEEEMKGKNIAFISVSLEKDMDVWKKMVKERKLEGIQLNVGDAKDFRSTYEISGMPFIILLDKEGKILRIRSIILPSSPHTLKLLQGLEGI